MQTAHCVPGRRIRCDGLLYVSRRGQWRYNKAELVDGAAAEYFEWAAAQARAVPFSLIAHAVIIDDVGERGDGQGGGKFAKLIARLGALR